MEKEIFKSDRYFTVFDFMVSHGQLLLRSSKNDDNIKNIDVIFFGTRYIQLFTSLYGMCVRIVDRNKNQISYDSVNLLLNNDKSCLFEIETKHEKFYIASSYFKVYENDLEFDETSLGLSGYKGREKEIAGSH
jgi:hypothetical protein